MTDHADGAPALILDGQERLEDRDPPREVRGAIDRIDDPSPARRAGSLTLLLAENAIVIAEYASKSKFQLTEKYGTLTRFRIYKQGDTSLAFYGPSATT